MMKLFIKLDGAEFWVLIALALVIAIVEHL